MKLCLIILLFLTEFVFPVLSVPRKYYLIQQEKTWHDAEAYCHTDHTDLGIIKSNDDLVRLQGHTQQFSSSAWIGLYREFINWTWSFGNEPVGDTYWKTGEPNNAGGIQWCVMTDSVGWIDKTCTDPFSFLCFDDTKTGNDKYIYIADQVTWYEAQAYCRNYHTDLASARDSAENSVVAGFASGNIWIGLSMEKWEWTDQSKFSTISWLSGQPDNAMTNEMCGYLNNGQAADEQCSDLMPFFCYSDITGRQQIMRMEVRSVKDVNDPAVMDAIMERIQQKLKEYGLEGNVTVNWRVQSYGKVFHKKN